MLLEINYTGKWWQIIDEEARKKHWKDVIVGFKVTGGEKTVKEETFTFYYDEVEEG